MVKMPTAKFAPVSEPFVFSVKQQSVQCDAFVHESGAVLLFIQALCGTHSDLSAMEREARVNTGIFWPIVILIVGDYVGTCHSDVISKPECVFVAAQVL